MTHKFGGGAAAGSLRCVFILARFHKYTLLGGGFKYCLFSSLFGEMIQFD